MAEQCICTKCKKTMGAINFYTYRDGSKCELCKPCLTMHINNWKPDTYMWLLEKFDVPYIEGEWNVLLEKAVNKAGGDPRKLTGMSVFGKYLSKMRLNQWKEYRWADTERIKLEADEKVELAKQAESEAWENIKESYEKGEITEAQYLTYMQSQAPDPSYNATEAFNAMMQEQQGNIPIANNPIEEVEIADVGADLTEEDKIYLTIKWGKLYTWEDKVWLEQKYNNFMNSFDIQGEARIDTLLFICKTSLKMNQALDCGDFDTYQKLAKVYDAQMKSAKFTEAQNKEDNHKQFDSVGALVLFAEKVDGKIERPDISTPRDQADKAIQIMNNYTGSLFKNDPGLAQQLEGYIKKLEINQEQKRDQKAAEAAGLDEYQLTDEDQRDFLEHIEEERIADSKFYTETEE